MEITACQSLVLTLYAKFYARTQRKIAIVSHWLALEGEPRSPSVDDHRNEPRTYASLFSEECRHTVDELLRLAMMQMRGATYAQSEDALECLSFLQEVISTAMWIHRCTVGQQLGSFARDYERLDLQEERKRIHAQAQTPSS